MKKNCWFLLLAGLLALAAPAFPASKPNILDMLADDLGYGELSCQGFTAQISTPEFDNDYFNGRYRDKGRPLRFSGYCTDFWFDEAMKWMRGPCICPPAKDWQPYRSIRIPLF